jgi:hypothetical protein
MDAFEHVVAEIFWNEGYWVRTSVAVELSKQQKRDLSNPSMPRPEIDIVAYRACDNHILALECKSYFDSSGVTHAEVSGQKASRTYKLFRNSQLRAVVLEQLRKQLTEQGFCCAETTVQLGMIAGKTYREDEQQLVKLFDENDWFFRGPGWVREKLSKQAAVGYTNQVSTVVTKILLRK